MNYRPYIATANRACSLLYSYIKEHSSGKWILPVNVCPDVPLTFCLAKVKFTFVDIDAGTLCLDFDQVEEILSKEPDSYTGVLFVRTYGALIDTRKEFRALKAIKENLLIIDDRCLCVPERNPNMQGADMVLYSTGHCKQIDFNGGGLAFYRKDEKYLIDSSLYYDGTDEEVAYKEAYNKVTPLRQIPIGWLKMEEYLSPVVYLGRIGVATNERMKQRERLNAIYKGNLPESIQMPNEFQTWRFNIRVPKELKTLILDGLFENGLFASSHYHSVNKLFNTQNYPVSDALFGSVINLFNDNYYDQEKALKTCKTVSKIMDKYKFTPPHLDNLTIVCTLYLFSITDEERRAA